MGREWVGGGGVEVDFGLGGGEEEAGAAPAAVMEEIELGGADGGEGEVADEVAGDGDGDSDRHVCDEQRSRRRRRRRGPGVGGKRCISGKVGVGEKVKGKRWALKMGLIFEIITDLGIMLTRLPPPPPSPSLKLLLYL